MRSDGAGWLIVRLEPYEAGSGLLKVEATVGGFSGVGEGYLANDDVRAFAERLAVYPLSADPVALATGYGRTAQDLDQETVRIEAHPVGRLGQLGVAVHLATASWPGDRPEAQRDVRFEVLTSYEAVRRFAAALLRLADGDVDEARLDGALLA
jgi:hypothetical protein